MVTQAQGDADAAAAIQAEATPGRYAEASAPRQGRGLRDNPELIARRPPRTERVLPTTMVPGGSLPFIDVGSGRSGQ